MFENELEVLNIVSKIFKEKFNDKFNARITSEDENNGYDYYDSVCVDIVFNEEIISWKSDRLLFKVLLSSEGKIVIYMIVDGECLLEDDLNDEIKKFNCMRNEDYDWTVEYRKNLRFKVNNSCDDLEEFEKKLNELLDEWNSSKEQMEKIICLFKEKKEVEGSIGLDFSLNSNGLSYAVSGIGECKDKKIVIPTMYHNLPVTVVGEGAFSEKRGITSVIIPEGIVSIEENAFCDCDNLESITIPNSVIKIKDFALAGCKITNIMISEKITEIGENTFYGCKYLEKFNTSNQNKIYKSIDGVLYSKDGKELLRYPIGKKDTMFKIPDFVEKINSFAFANTIHIQKVELNDNVKVIDECAFANCLNLKEVKVNRKLEILGRAAFNGCSNLKSIELFEGLKVIEDSSFSNCNNLSEVNIPETLERLGDNAFSGCSGLTNITIPETIKCLGDDIFKGCENLTIKCNRKKPFLGKVSGWEKNWNSKRPVKWL